MMRRLALALALQSLLGAAAACAAEAAPADQTELRRGFTAVGSRVSDEPALRLERQTHEPSPSFMVGSSFAAWSNASAGLAYDATHPSGDGDDSGLIDEDCFDEKIAFGHLQDRSAGLGLQAADVIAQAGVQAGILASWASRQTAHPKWCH
jgi:hypothetical protein